MEEYLEKRKYVYRKSYKYYDNLDFLITSGEFLCSASGLAAFVFLPLAGLSLSAGLIELIRRNIKCLQRKQEYKNALKFYNELLLLYKAGKITEEEICLRENTFLQNLEFLPREKYLKKAKINGHQFF